MPMKFKIFLILSLISIVFLAGCGNPPAEDDVVPLVPDDTETIETPQQPSPQPQPTPVPEVKDEIKPLNENAVLYKTLAETGIEALVDYQIDKILIAFELPDGMDEEKTAYYVLGVASQIAAPDQQLMVEILQNGSGKVYSVRADKVQKFFAGQLNEQQLQSSVSVS